MPKNRYYYYDNDSCSFVEIQPRRSKLYAQVAGALMLMVMVAGLAAWGMDQRVIGSPEELALQAENEALQQQLATVSSRMVEFSKQLEELSETDAELYRTILQADPISDDVRRAGVGGSDAYQKFDRFSGSTASLLKQTSQKLDELERRMSLQNASYRELSTLAEEHHAWMEQMPAILPADGPLISGYGMRRHPILQIMKMHHGIDIALKTGNPIYATGDGIVSVAGRKAGYGGYGICVEIKHPQTGYATLYAHLSRLPDGIEPGKRVERGDLIGYSGATGRASGPHLHYEVRDRDGNTLNPVYFFAPSMSPQEYKTLLEQAENSTISLD